MEKKDMEEVKRIKPGNLKEFFSKNLVSIVLIAVILVESSFLGVTINSINILQAETDSTIQDLREEFNSLNQSYEFLDQGYDSMSLDFLDLQREYDIERCLRIGNSLESYYDYLRQEIGPTGAKNWWNTPDSDYWQQVADFAANLGLHDLRKIYWPSIEDDYYNAVGEYSYDTARDKIVEVLNLIGIESHYSSSKKIEFILNFVNSYISYETEVNDVFSAPVETLGFKSGDCDDFTILCAALFEYYEIESAVGLFVNDLDEYHAMVLVRLDSLGDYGYWYYSDLTSLGLSAGKWIKIEPQITIDKQKTDWLSDWDIFAASALDT